MGGGDGDDGGMGGWGVGGGGRGESRERRGERGEGRWRMVRGFSRGGVCGLKWRFWGVWGGFCDGGMH